MQKEIEENQKFIDSQKKLISNMDNLVVIEDEVKIESSITRNEEIPVQENPFAASVQTQQYKMPELTKENIQKQIQFSNDKCESEQNLQKQIQSLEQEIQNLAPDEASEFGQFKPAPPTLNLPEYQQKEILTSLQQPTTVVKPPTL